MTSGEGRPPRRHFNARMSVRFPPLTTLATGRSNLRNQQRTFRIGQRAARSFSERWPAAPLLDRHLLAVQGHRRARPWEIATIRKSGLSRQRRRLARNKRSRSSSAHDADRNDEQYWYRWPRRRNVCHGRAQKYAHIVTSNSATLATAIATRNAVIRSRAMVAE